MEAPERGAREAMRMRLPGGLSLRVLRLVTGAVILWETAPALIGAWGPNGDPHILLLASAEGAGAVLFLAPPTLRLGAGVLLATFGVAFVAHGLQGELAAPLLVYGAAVTHVMVRVPESPPEAAGRSRTPPPGDPRSGAPG